MSLRITIFLILFYCCIPFSHGANTPLTLENAPFYALQHNLALSAARLKIAEAQGRFHQAGRLSNPEVELEIRRNVRAPEGSVGFTLNQKFPLTGRLRQEKKISRAELKSVEAEVKNAERLLITEVRTLMIKLLALKETRSLRNRQLVNNQILGRFAAQRIETGEGSTVEASLVELETQQLEMEQLELAVEEAAAIGELRPLLGIPATDDPVIIGSLPGLGRNSGAPLTLVLRPDLQASQSTLEAARENVVLARAERWEDIGVGLNLMEERTEDAPEGYRRDTFAGLKFSLPFPFWNNNAGRIQEATATAARAQTETVALGLAIQSESVAAHQAIISLSKLISAMDRGILPKITRIEEQLRASYSTGETSLPEVLRMRDRRLLIERQRLDALRDYHLARVRYQAATNQIERP